MGSSRDSSLASLVVVIRRRKVGGIFPLQDARRVGNEKQFSSILLSIVHCYIVVFGMGVELELELESCREKNELTARGNGIVKA